MKILLSLMPFWSPLAPPLGISLLKSYLGRHGFDANIYDFNTEDELWQFLDQYLNIIGQSVPADKQSNFHMVGHDVLSNHLMAYLHKNSDHQYIELVKFLMKKNYYVDIDNNVAEELCAVIHNFYTALSRSIQIILDKQQPDILGLSVYSTSLGPSLFTFKTAKQLFPEIKTLMGGGVFADLLTQTSPNFPIFLERTRDYLDTVFVGEGEQLLLKFLNGELPPDKRVYSLDDIDRQELELSDVDIPDFSGLSLDAYSQMSTYASRSCPFQCSFCSETVQWGRFRKKHIDQIAGEISQIKSLYGGKLFMFGDSLMNHVVTPLSKRLIKDKTDIYWDGYLRADPNVCVPENTKLWRESGLYRVRLGIESGSQHVLDMMDKRITPKQIQDALQSLAGQGIRTTTYWVVGFPGETEDDFEDTLDLLAELKESIYEADWHPFYFFPRGQVSSNDWTETHGIEPVYPDEYVDLLMTQTWSLATNPTREQIYDRLNRFGEACKTLGIPNRYSLQGVYQADKRWQTLHPGCGPSSLELHNFQHLK